MGMRPTIFSNRLLSGSQQTCDSLAMVEGLKMRLSSCDKDSLFICHGGLMARVGVASRSDVASHSNST